MRRCTPVWLAATLLVTAAGCDEGCGGGLVVDDDDSADGHPSIQRDIVYSGGTAGEPVLGDLFVPGGVAEPPVVVMVHGGSFYGGERGELEPLAQALADDGLAVFNIDYRLLEHGGEFPGALIDVLDASRFLRAHATEYRLGPVCGQLGISGGATMVTLAALHRDDADLARDAWPALRGYRGAADVVVGLSGIYDFTTREEQHGTLPWWESDWLGGLPDEAPQTYAYASASQQVPLAVGPLLLMHGEADGAVEPQQSVDFAAALDAGGVANELVLYPDALHGFIWPLDGADGADALARSLAALHAACDDPPQGDQARGTTEVRQSGSLEGAGEPMVYQGTEQYAWIDRDDESSLCEASFDVEGNVDGAVLSLTYTEVSADGDCEGAPYRPVDGETMEFTGTTDSRDGRAILVRDVPDKAWISWFDLTSSDVQTMTYERTTVVAP